ncbi:TetR/AcrR family transcriptional regulator [Streptomyces piniterrae]|uniref:TetR/AcrR family transcriptional regulator n=1 Tax=Streptomyces piniterrae TaxID=2571125 RepID=A0A4U0NP20_9ACTN|nr:TetR/AcrR family transcriptional regulator [Streptomyces piniterrae]TJZ56080.1 TetR/AcrR family transcriptional regulator [Streptomyces piniterrae]
MANDGSETDPTAARRTPAGAAVLREDKTAAIRAAVFEELAAVGFARMSIEGIARRAGVGKTAVYRRWRSKLHLVLDVVSAVAAAGLPTPDTGSLRGDVRMVLEVAARALRHPMASQIIPDLLAEAARSPELAEALQTALHDSQAGVAAAVVAKAVERGELPADADARLALDLMAGPLYWRLLVVRDELPEGYLDSLSVSVAAALGAE